MTGLTLRITPGHTPGTLAYYIPVKDHGKSMNILMLSGANITPDRASLDAFKKALDYAKQQKAQALINGHPGLFGDEIGWMEQVRSNPNGPTRYAILTNTTPLLASCSPLLTGTDVAPPVNPPPYIHTKTGRLSVLVLAPVHTFRYRQSSLIGDSGIKNSDV